MDSTPDSSNRRSPARGERRRTRRRPTESSARTGRPEDTQRAGAAPEDPAGDPKRAPDPDEWLAAALARALRSLF